MMKTSSGAYATEDNASLANTGSAIRLGNKVSPNWLLRNLRPTRMRLDTSPTLTGGKPRPGGRWSTVHLCMS